MIPFAEVLPRKSRLAALLDHFADVEDPRDVRRILHPLPEVLLLVVCGTIADCDDYEDIAGWGAAHLDFLRRHLPYENGRARRALAHHPDEPDQPRPLRRRLRRLGARELAGEGRPRRHRRQDLAPQPRPQYRRSPLHLVSAFATTARLVFAQEAVPDKGSELAAIPPLLERLGAEDGLKGALVSIDAVATNAEVARAIAAQGADWLLAVKANQPTLRAEVEAAFAEAGELETHADLDKGHGRIEERRTAVLREVDWLAGGRRFPGELRLPGTACLVRAETRVEARGAVRAETRYFISSRTLSAAEAATAIRGHWAIENRLHWVLDVTFADDQSRLRKGHGARNMATVRHFALNLVRTAQDKRSIKSRRKIAGWDPTYLEAILASRPA